MSKYVLSNHLFILRSIDFKQETLTFWEASLQKEIGCLHSMKQEEIKLYRLEICLKNISFTQYSRMHNRRRIEVEKKRNCWNLKLDRERGKKFNLWLEVMTVTHFNFVMTGHMNNEEFTLESFHDKNPRSWFQISLNTVPKPIKDALE